MEILRPTDMSLLQQKQSLLIQAYEIFRTRLWLDSKGNLKKTINYRSRNIKLENITIRFAKWENDQTVLLLVLSFDAHYKTEQEEAIRHKFSYWALNADPRHDIKKLGSQIGKLDSELRNQMIFTDKIDMNLYNYYELDKKGWQIIKKIEKK